MKTILLFEPHVSGHRMHYVRYIVEQVPRSMRIAIVLVIGTEYVQHPQVTRLIAQYRDIIRLFPVELGDWRRQGRGILGRLTRQMYYVRLINKVLRHPSLRGIVSGIFIPFLDDYCHYALALRPRAFGSIRWGGIAIRPRHHLRAFNVKVPRRWLDYVDWVAYRRLMWSITLEKIFSIDPYFAKYYCSPKIESICDPADLVATVSSHDSERKSDQKVVLLVYGYIDERKGLHELLQVVGDPAVPKSLQVLIAGVQSESTRLLLRSEAADRLRRAGRLTEINSEIPVEDEVALFSSVDIIWIFYPRSYCSSGALVRAGQSSRPVVSTSEGLVGRVVIDLGMGITAPEGAPLILVPLLVSLVVDIPLRQRMGRAGLAHFSEATTASFGSAIVSRFLAVVND